MKRLLPILVCAALAAPPAMAGEHYPPVTDRLTLKECGDCHMAFQPSMLPARSWRALMVGLDDHFGENASLDPETARHIEAYLVANAGDVSRSRGFFSWRSGKMLRFLSDSETPLRISDLRCWKRMHDELPRGAFSRANVRSKANCVACHKRAAQGDYEED